MKMDPVETVEGGSGWILDWYNFSSSSSPLLTTTTTSPKESPKGKEKTPRPDLWDRVYHAKLRVTKVASGALAGPRRAPRRRSALCPAPKGPQLGSVTGFERECPVCHQPGCMLQGLRRPWRSSSEVSTFCLRPGTSLHGRAPPARSSSQEEACPHLTEAKTEDQTLQGPQRDRDGFRVQIPLHNNGKNTKNHSS